MSWTTIALIIALACIPGAYWKGRSDEVHRLIRILKGAYDPHAFFHYYNDEE